MNIKEPNLKLRQDLKNVTVKVIGGIVGILVLTHLAGAFDIADPTVTTNNAAGTGGGGTTTILSAFVGTQYSITVQTPTAGTLAWATDTMQLLIYNGTNWFIDSGYTQLQTNNYDMGYQQFSNHAGYGLNYVTDKTLANCTIGYGSLAGIEGQIRQNPNAHILQIFQNASWQTIVTNFNLSETNGYILTDNPVGYLSKIRLYNGDSTTLGLNGYPVVHNYIVDMGAYPFPTVINGGSF